MTCVSDVPFTISAIRGANSNILKMKKNYLVTLLVISKGDDTINVRRIEMGRGKQVLEEILSTEKVQVLQDCT